MKAIMQITEYERLLLLLSAAIVVCIITFIWMVRRMRKSSPAQISLNEAEPQKDKLTLEERFTTILKKQNILLEHRLAAWNHAASKYRPGAGGLFSFHALEKPLHPYLLFATRELVQEYSTLLSHQQAPRIGSALMSINLDFALLSARTSSMGQSFKNQYEYATQLFGFYVFQLNRLNDQFEKRLRNGRMEPSLFNFETNYTEIFGDWMASGVEKSIQELYRDLVIRIVFLNNQFPHNPTFNQIVEYTTKCERAYDIIEGLDRKVKDLHKDGCLVITRALRLLRCIVGSGAFKATPGLSSAAEASFAPPVTEGSRVSQPVSFSAWAKSNLRDTHLDQEKVLNTTRTKVTHNPPDESKARPKRAWMTHLSSWIVLGLLFLLLIYSGYALRKYHDRESTVENSFAGVSHPPVDCAQGIHDFKQHYDLLKPRLDSAHRLMKLDTLLNLLANPKLDSVEIHAIKAHMDSLKSGHDHANGPDLMYGIDVSFWQKKIDWKRVANDPSGPKPIHFAILRATYGLNKDLRFDTNWSSAKEHIPVIGAYHFLHFLDDPIQQANLFILSAPLIQGNMRPILDIETNCQDCDPTMGLTKDELVQHVRDFLKVIEAHYNTKAIIYSNKYFYDTYLKDQFPAHDFWLAEHNGERSVEKVMEAYRNPPDQEIPVMWQFSATGKISGIAPKLNVDLNFLKSTYVERIIIN